MLNRLHCANITHNLPASLSVFFPASDLVPTNLFLVLLLAETRVQLVSCFSLSSSAGSSAMFFRYITADRSELLCSCVYSCKTHDVYLTIFPGKRLTVHWVDKYSPK